MNDYQTTRIAARPGPLRTRLAASGVPANSLPSIGQQHTGRAATPLRNTDNHYNQPTHQTRATEAGGQRQWAHAAGSPNQPASAALAQQVALSPANAPPDGMLPTGHGVGATDELDGDADMADVFDEISASIRAQEYTTLREPLRLDRRADVESIKQQREHFIHRLFYAQRQLILARREGSVEQEAEQGCRQHRSIPEEADEIWQRQT